MTNQVQPGFFLYCITNDVNDRVYIGQTANPAKRWRSHTQLSNFAKSKRKKPIQSAMLKYGVARFSFELIGQFRSQSELDGAEVTAIACHGATVYNLAPGGRKGGSGPLSAEAREKISSKLTGHKHSESTRAKLSETRRRFYESHTHPRKGIPRSQETKDKIAAKLKGGSTSERQKQAVRDYMASLTPEQRQERLRKAWDARAKLHPQITDKMKEGIKLARTGKPLSAETRAKISVKARERWDRIRAGELPRPPDPPRCEQSEAYRQKVSEGLKRSWAKRKASK